MRDVDHTLEQLRDWSRQLLERSADLLRRKEELSREIAADLAARHESSQDTATGQFEPQVLDAFFAQRTSIIEVQIQCSDTSG